MGISQYNKYCLYKKPKLFKLLRLNNKDEIINYLKSIHKTSTST